MIRKTTTEKLWIFLVLILEVNFFYILPLPNAFWFGNNSNNKSYILIILYYLLLSIFIKGRGRIRKELYSFLFPYLTFQLLISFILVLHSKQLYNQTWFNMAMCADYLMFPITSIVFVRAMDTKCKYNDVLKMIFYIILIVQCVILINGIVFKVTGVTVFRGINKEGSLLLRDIGFIRSPWCSLIFIAYTFAYTNFLKKDYSVISKQKLKLFLFITIINVFLFCGTRMIIAALLTLTLAVYLIAQNKLSLKTLLMILLIVAVISFSNIMDVFYNSFSLKGAGAGSTSVRLREIEYYSKAILAEPVFGLGLINPKTPRLLYLYGGGFGTPTDIGLLGLIAEVGCLGLFVFIILYIRAVLIVIHNFKERQGLFLFGLLFYISVTLPTLIITNVGRVVALPICMAIFETTEYRRKISANDNK